MSPSPVTCLLCPHVPTQHNVKCWVYKPGILRQFQRRQLSHSYCGGSIVAVWWQVQWSTAEQEDMTSMNTLSLPLNTITPSSPNKLTKESTTHHILNTTIHALVKVSFRCLRAAYQKQSLSFGLPYLITIHTLLYMKSIHTTTTILLN